MKKSGSRPAPCVPVRRGPRRTPPASDKIEIDDKHLRERFVIQKNIFGSLCAAVYKRADARQIMNSGGPAPDRHCLVGPLISITGLIFPSPPSPSSVLLRHAAIVSPLPHRRGEPKDLNSPPPPLTTGDLGTRLSRSKSRATDSLKRVERDRVALCGPSKLDSDPDPGARLFSPRPWLKSPHIAAGGMAERRTRAYIYVCMCDCDCLNVDDINPFRSKDACSGLQRGLKRAVNLSASGREWELRALAASHILLSRLWNSVTSALLHLPLCRPNCSTLLQKFHISRPVASPLRHELPPTRESLVVHPCLLSRSVVRVFTAN